MKGKYVLTVAGAKGGVGKTTTSTNLGACFANAGLRTVVVEADVAMANVVDFVDLGVDIDPSDTLHDVLTGQCDVLDAVYDVDGRFSIVPSDTDIDRYSDLDIARLESALAQLWWQFDVVILDTPAGMGEEVIRPLELADEVVLVSTPRVSSVRNTYNTKMLVERAGTDVRGLVLAKSGTGASPGADRIADFLDLELLGHVPEDDAVPHSQDKGEPVVEFAPRSGAAIAYRLIASQLIETTGFDGAPSRSDLASDATDPDPDVDRVATGDRSEDGTVPEGDASDDRRTRGDRDPSAHASDWRVPTTDGAGHTPSAEEDSEYETDTVRNADGNDHEREDGPTGGAEDGDVAGLTTADTDAVDDGSTERSRESAPDSDASTDEAEQPEETPSDGQASASLVSRIRSSLGF